MSATPERFSILGRSLDLQASTPRLLAWLERQWSFPEHALPPVPYGIRLVEVDAPPGAPAGTPVPVPLHRMTLTALAGDDVWWFGDEGAGVQLRLGSVESRIAIWGAAHEQESAATMYAALFVSIAESLRASGLLPLHAAVAARAGRATVLAGPSGVGKSTTLWRMARAGWAPLAEDFAWLDPATCVVYGWDRGVRLWPETRERFAPEVPPERFHTDLDGKLFLAYEHFPGPAVRAATVERLAVLERVTVDGATGGSTTNTATPAAPAPLAPRDAVRAWWESVGLPLSPAVRDQVARAIGTLVQRVDAVQLPIGPGPLVLEDA
ncbi:MAG TPA: hypothetical protein VFR95_08095 [Gemmatimonadaceae bacterium]|nr:hypothetical protein [Gemmatimonadaceae bacterium]